VNKLEFHGTDTDISDAAIVYVVMCIVYSTHLHVYTCASLTDVLERILARKSMRVG